MSKGLATIALLGLTPACAWNSEWTFAATNATYGSDAGDRSDGPPPVSPYSGGAREAGQVAVVAVGFLLLPLVFDLAFLPIEWTHDQVVLD